MTFNAFLYQLCNGNNKVTAQTIRSLMPGLAETIDRSTQHRHSLTPTSTVISKFAPDIGKVGSYGVIQPFLDPSNELCKRRMDDTLINLAVKCKLTSNCFLDMLHLLSAFILCLKCHEKKRRMNKANQTEH